VLIEQAEDALSRLDRRVAFGAGHDGAAKVEQAREDHIDLCQHASLIALTNSARHATGERSECVPQVGHVSSEDEVCEVDTVALDTAVANALDRSTDLRKGHAWCALNRRPSKVGFPQGNAADAATDHAAQRRSIEPLEVRGDANWKEGSFQLEGRWKHSRLHSLFVISSRKWLKSVSFYDSQFFEIEEWKGWKYI
jgi:hypothetical protein